MVGEIGKVKFIDSKFRGYGIPTSGYAHGGAFAVLLSGPDPGSNPQRRYQGSITAAGDEAELIIVSIWYMEGERRMISLDGEGLPIST